jgi:hypothetical protein
MQYAILVEMFYDHFYFSKGQSYFESFAEQGFQNDPV